MKYYEIGPNDAGQRLDKFIQKAVPALPPSLLYKYIRLKRIKYNGKRCDAAQKLNVGDVLELYINDEFFTVSNEKYDPLAFLKAKAEIDIVFEDVNILLVDKKPGLLVHEDANEQTNTLIARIQHYLYDKGEYRPEHENSFAPALCNRIDRNTGGIVIAAKNAATLRVLNAKIKSRELTKLYLCIVFGQPNPPSATLRGYLLKDEESNQVQIFDQPVPGAKTILTRYHTLAAKNELSLLEVELLTGRTHQIRAQLAYIGHPLLGDTKYGLNRDNKGYGQKHQALYAYKLSFDFTTDAEHLNYLQGQSFTVPDVDFVKMFF